MKLDELLEKLESSSVMADEPTDRVEKIRFRREKLLSAGEELKKQFVGLDHIIDEVMGNIENWYVMPELSTRPIIVCLWGMTGVGKTELVRKLVKAIGFGDKFLEVQMSGGRTGDSSIKDRIEFSNISRGEPGIILLDEIQRWRTVDERGNDTQNNKFQDLWMLLSDGKFSSKIQREALFGLAYGGSLYWIPNEFEDGSTEEDEDDEFLDEEEKEEKEKRDRRNKRKKKKTYSRSYNEAMRIKKLLQLNESVLEVMRWTPEKKQEMALARINNPDIYDGDDYSNLLIFISGNLDEAYAMAKSVNDTDVEADVLHAFSQQINFLSIKRALKTRFKPEQISRFGNTHVIYPSMSRSSYEELIVKKLSELSALIKNRHKITITFSKDIHDFVYRNGVIPSQGVRPVFSTISGYVENAIPKILLRAVEKGIDKVEVTYSKEMIWGQVGNESISVPAIGKVDEIKKSNNMNSRSLVSVHEAGHALVYAIKFGVAPTQIVSSTTSTLNEGYVGLHNIRHTNKSIGDLIATCMAGRVAEELVFGPGNCSTGAASDIAMATSLAAQYVRDWGFGDYNTVLRERTKPASEKANNTQSDKVDEQIESFVTKGMEEAEKIIRNNTPLFREIVDTLLEDEKISQIDFQKILKKHNIEVRVVDPKRTLYQNYSSSLKDFLSGGGLLDK